VAVRAVSSERAKQSQLTGLRAWRSVVVNQWPAACGPGTPAAVSGRWCWCWCCVRVLVGRLVGRCPMCRRLLVLAEECEWSDLLGAGLLADVGGRRDSRASDRCSAEATG